MDVQKWTFSQKNEDSITAKPNSSVETGRTSTEWGVLDKVNRVEQMHGPLFGYVFGEGHAIIVKTCLVENA